MDIASLKINKKMHTSASVEDIWDALINPIKIKKYLFGTDVESDWKDGSEIIFRGDFEGYKYEERGIIKSIIPMKYFEYTLHPSSSDLEDKEENHLRIRMNIIEGEENNTLDITQDNFKIYDQIPKAEDHWNLVIELLKELLES